MASGSRSCQPPCGWSDSCRKHDSSRKPKLRHDGEDSGTGCRLRCPALRAQTAGQPPALPKACTTVVLRNIPKSCTPDVLLASLHESGYFGEIDFVYIPIDFKHGGCSLGLAVLNFRTISACLQFASEFHMVEAGDVMGDAKCKKLLEVSPAGIQSSQENIGRLQKS